MRPQKPAASCSSASGGAHLIVEPNILLHAPTKMLFGGVDFSVSLLPFEGGKESLSHGVIQWPGRCRERLLYTVLLKQTGQRF